MVHRKIQAAIGEYDVLLAMVKKLNWFGHVIRSTGVELRGQSTQIIIQGPVVQSIVSLTSSLRGQLDKCFTTV